MADILQLCADGWQVLSVIARGLRGPGRQRAALGPGPYSAARRCSHRLARLNRRNNSPPRRNHFPVPAKSSGNEHWAIDGLGQTTGFDHVGVHPQLNLPRNSQNLPVRNAQARNRLMGLCARGLPRHNRLKTHCERARLRIYDNSDFCLPEMRLGS